MNVLFIAPFDLRIRDGTTVRVINLVRAVAQVCDTVFLASYTNNEYLKALSNIVHIRLKNIQLRYHLAMAFTSSILTRLASRALQLCNLIINILTLFLNTCLQMIISSIVLQMY